MRTKIQLCMCLLLGVSAAWSAQFPKTASESLAGQAVTLPEAVRAHGAVVIIGFTKGSQNGVKAWDEQARKRLGDGLDVYQVAVLEDAPAFVRGMIKHAMKSGVPADRQGHFLVVVKGEAELKGAVHYAVGSTEILDEPYAVLVDGSGEIRWLGHGAVSDAALDELSAEVKKLR